MKVSLIELRRVDVARAGFASSVSGSMGLSMSNLERARSSVEFSISVN